MAGNQRPREDFSLKETSPNIAGRSASTGPMTAFDLVEQMQYLYVRVVKARDLPYGCDPYVEFKIGNYRVNTRYLENKPDLEWNQVFAFKKERIQDISVEILVKDKSFAVANGDGIIGKFSFNVFDAPKRVPPDSPLAPQWYKLGLANQDGWVRGELMLCFWIGTQADEVFPDASHSDTGTISGEGVSNTRSKVYLSPRLWYLRVNVIEAQDLILRGHENRKQPPEIFVVAILGNKRLKTGVSKIKSVNPAWNEDLMFVAAEPFEEVLWVSVQERVNGKEESLGRCKIPLKSVDKRIDAAPPDNKWHNLWRVEELEVVENVIKEVKFASKIHMRISLDGGYHVFDEPSHNTSDLRPTAKILWRAPIGVLELGILSASGLSPMNPTNRVNAYCVAKYGPKWTRTRTIVASSDPMWNEQYTWEVFDPCTVITVAVFQNGNLHSRDNMDLPIGKVKIRLSTLETDRIYTNSFPLGVLLPDGVKKMGEIQLAVRFSCTSLINMLLTYRYPVLPRMHYLLPLSVFQLSHLRQQASSVIAYRLSRAEPPLREEVVAYMLDVNMHRWSLRRCRTNYDRIIQLFDGFIGVFKWFDQIRKWTNPIATVLTYISFLVTLLCPQIILPLMFFALFGLGIWRYRGRPRQLPHVDAELSHAYTFHEDVFDEEFDPIPTTRTGNILAMRYDRLRQFAGEFQERLDDIATQGERVQSLLSWRDPRATAICVALCFIVGLVTYILPFFNFQVLAIVAVTYLLRHPCLRINIPSYPQILLRRMPARSDCTL